MKNKAIFEPCDFQRPQRSLEAIPAICVRMIFMWHLLN